LAATAAPEPERADLWGTPGTPLVRAFLADRRFPNVAVMTGHQRLRQTRSSQARRWTLPLGLVVALSAAACASVPGGAATPTPDGPRASPTPSKASPEVSVGAPDTADPATPRVSGTTRVRVRVGDRVFRAELYDNPTARDLADQLPLTITMDDLNRLEKTGPLPRALTTDGVPAGSDPEVDEIGYYAPGRDLVLYYGDVGYYHGIIRIGRFQDSIDLIADEPDGVSVTVERV
jgi:hypothetical protein